VALDIGHLEARCDNGLCGVAACVNGQHGKVAFVSVTVRPEVFGRSGGIVVATSRQTRRWLPIWPGAGTAIRIDMQVQTVIARRQTGEVWGDLQTGLRVRKAKRPDLLPTPLVSITFTETVLLAA
jgi:hypothetical protein